MRIRTIKPEFWESETLGGISREARLLFVGLFSCCDDYGRTRGNSRLLASRLFPYDNDAIKLLPGWLKELTSKNCIRVYEVEGETYIDIPKWLSHQKIDHPTKSKLPEFASPREDSREFEKNSLGTGNGNGNGNREQGGDSGVVAQTTTTTEGYADAEAADKPQPAAKETDVEWLERLSQDPTYEGIDVKREHGKMVNWCGVKRLKASRARFINWLNKAEKPMKGVGPDGKTADRRNTGTAFDAYNAEWARAEAARQANPPAEDGCL